MDVTPRTLKPQCKTRTAVAVVQDEVLVPPQKEKLTGEAAEYTLYLFVTAQWIKIFAFLHYYTFQICTSGSYFRIAGSVFNC